MDIRNIHLEDFECPRCGQKTLYVSELDAEGLPIGTIECVSCGAEIHEAIDVQPVVNTKTAMNGVTLVICLSRMNRTNTIALNTPLRVVIAKVAVSSGAGLKGSTSDRATANTAKRSSMMMTTKTTTAAITTSIMNGKTS